MTELENTAKLAHYIIARTRPEELGATKLNKVLWFSELAYYRKYGRSITGAISYKKRQHGPVPNKILAAKRSLIDDGKITERQVPTPVGHRNEFVWLLEPLITEYDSREIDILHEVIDWVTKDHTANSVSNLTHDALWDETEIGKDIPISAASVIPGEITDEDIEWANKIN